MFAKRFTTASLLAWSLLNSVALGQDIQTDDILNQCTIVCSSVVTASDTCQRYADSDANNQYHNCICTGSNAKQVLQLCEACIFEARKANTGMNDADARNNDVNDLLGECGYGTTTYILASSATPSAPLTPNTMASTNSMSVVTLTNMQRPTSISGGGSISQSIVTGQDLSNTASSISASLTAASGSLSSATNSAESSSISNQISQLSSSLTSATAAASTGAAGLNRDDVRIGGAAFAGAIAMIAAALA